MDTRTPQQSNWTGFETVTCKMCRSEFHTANNTDTCPSCKRESKPTDYGLRFYGGVAEPTQAFWRAWRADKDAVKRQGYAVRKKGSGNHYKVHRLEKSDKARVKEAISDRYSRKNNFGMR